MVSSREFGTAKRQVAYMDILRSKSDWQHILLYSHSRSSFIRELDLAETGVATRFTFSSLHSKR